MAKSFVLIIIYVMFTHDLFMKNGGSKVEASRLFGFFRNILYRWLSAVGYAPKKHIEAYFGMFLHERRASYDGFHKPDLR